MEIEAQKWPRGVVLASGSHSKILESNINTRLAESVDELRSGSEHLSFAFIHLRG